MLGVRRGLESSRSVRHLHVLRPVRFAGLHGSCGGLFPALLTLCLAGLLDKLAALPFVGLPGDLVARGGRRRRLLPAEATGTFHRRVQRLRRLGEIDLAGGNSGERFGSGRGLASCLGLGDDGVALAHKGDLVFQDPAEPHPWSNRKVPRENLQGPDFCDLGAADAGLVVPIDHVLDLGVGKVCKVVRFPDLSLLCPL